MRQVIPLLLIVVIGFIGVALPYPIFAPLFLHPEHATIVPFGWHESMRSIMLGIVLSVYPFGQFFGSPILGSLSDQHGRKPILIISLAGTIIGYFLTGLSLHFGSLPLLIASRLLTGFLEGNIAIARSAAADMQSMSKYKMFGAITASATLGYIVGPILGGVLSDSSVVSWFSFSLPFYFAMLISFIAMLLTIFFFQETLDFSREIIRVPIRQQLRIFRKLKRLCENEKLKVLFIAGSLLTLGTDIFYQFSPVYLVVKWHMLPMGVALYNVTLCVGLTIGSVGLADTLSRRVNSITAIVAPAMIYVVCLLVMLIPNQQLYLYPLFVVIGTALGIMVTHLAVFVSNVSTEKQQGEVMGMMWGLRTLGDGTICLIGGVLVAFSIKLPILLAAIVVLCGAMYLFSAFRQDTQTKQH